MPMKQTIAISAFALSATLSAHGSDSYRVTNTLCTEPRYAIELATARSSGQEQEMAIDAVGRRAGKAVCAFYAGRAVIAERKTVTKAGVLYRLTKWLFVKDRSGGWIAESAFTPDDDAGPI